MDIKSVFDKAWSEVCENIPKIISNPEDAVPYFAHERKSEIEKFMVLTLNGSHATICCRVVSAGIVNKAIIHPREVFRGAIKDNAVAVVLAHNHPSGNLEPSKEDREITRRLSEAGQILGIEVLDHLIISERGYYSFLEEGETI